jgi:predicted nucleic acid-binding protein
VNDVWIVDASPLIALAKISRLSLLAQLSANLIIPQGVASELLQGSAGDPARRWIETAGKVYVKFVGQPEPLVASWNLGLGESEVLSLGLRMKNSEAILDDAAARKCAKTLRIATRGTLGVILTAKKRGLISEATSVFNDLRVAGFHIDDALFKHCLRLAGE